jgi:transcriptional regulator with XRE-family HTH domain
MSPPEVQTTHLPTRIRTLRARRGLTQDQLAEKAEVSLKHLQRLESGKEGNPSFELLVRLSDALSIPLYEMLYIPEELLAALLERNDLFVARQVES